jgi:hypothetical protein
MALNPFGVGKPNLYNDYGDVHLPTTEMGTQVPLILTSASTLTIGSTGKAVISIGWVKDSTDSLMRFGVATLTSSSTTMDTYASASCKQSDAASTIIGNNRFNVSSVGLKVWAMDTALNKAGSIGVVMSNTKLGAGGSTYYPVSDWDLARSLPVSTAEAGLTCRFTEPLDRFHSTGDSDMVTAYNVFAQKRPIIQLSNFPSGSKVLIQAVFHIRTFIDSPDDSPIYTPSLPMPLNSDSVYAAIATAPWYTSGHSFKGLQNKVNKFFSVGKNVSDRIFASIDDIEKVLSS